MRLTLTSGRKLAQPCGARLLGLAQPCGARLLGLAQPARTSHPGRRL